MGLILDPSLSFEKHFNENIMKAKKYVGMLKHLSLDQIYKALARSYLDYCDIIYHIPSHRNQPPLDYCDIIYHIPSHRNQPPLGVTLNLQMEKVE